jgi:hypothetical protein
MPGKGGTFKAFLPRATGFCGPTVFDELDFSHPSTKISPHISMMRGEVMPIYEFYCPQCNTVYNFFLEGSTRKRFPAVPPAKRFP